MAEKKDGGSPYEILWLMVGILGALVVMWVWTGGPERADLRGIFLAPPAPVGTGESYGPGNSTTTNEIDY